MKKNHTTVHNTQMLKTSDTVKIIKATRQNKKTQFVQRNKDKEDIKFLFKDTESMHIFKVFKERMPGWLSQLRVGLQPRS